MSTRANAAGFLAISCSSTLMTLSRVSILSANSFSIAVKSAASFFMLAVATAKFLSPVALPPESSSIFGDEAYYAIQFQLQ